MKLSRPKSCTGRRASAYTANDQLCTIDESVYGYRPSLPANIAFAALFSTATIVHIILGIKWKTWWFMWCMILGSTHEVAGYVGRIILYINPWSFVAFIIQISTYSEVD